MIYMFCLVNHRKPSNRSDWMVMNVVDHLGFHTKSIIPHVQNPYFFKANSAFFWSFLLTKSCMPPARRGYMPPASSPVINDLISREESTLWATSACDRELKVRIQIAFGVIALVLRRGMTLE